MKEFKYVVTDNEGIHARPAGELVKLVKGFESKITIEKDGKTVECRKLLALMGLGVKKGHEVTFTFDGAQRPLRALSGTRVLLTAAPTAPPCIRRWRRSSPLHFFLASPI